MLLYTAVWGLFTRKQRFEAFRPTAASCSLLRGDGTYLLRNRAVQLSRIASLLCHPIVGSLAIMCYRSKADAEQCSGCLHHV